MDSSIPSLTLQLGSVTIAFIWGSKLLMKSFPRAANKGGIILEALPPSNLDFHLPSAKLVFFLLDFDFVCFVLEQFENIRVEFLNNRLFLSQ